VPILRPCSGALKTALAAGNIRDQADLFTLSILGASTYHWTSWDSDLTVGAQLFASSASSFQQPQRGQWRVINTMEVPTLDVIILDNSTAGFTGIGSPRFRTQVHNGLLDGASFLLQRVYMPTPGDTATLGTVDIFSGDVGQVTLTGAQTVLKIRGKNSRLDRPAPLNVYQPGCIHTFCDAGCTLSAATFTLATTVSVGTRTIVKVNAVPSPASQVRGGTLTMTSGVAAGQKRSIIQVSTVTSLVLAYPLTAAPSPGDTCTVFTGCDKTLGTCDGTYSNKVNFRGFPYIPPPASAAVGQ
jgi:uncharacterized phage protein (TIGR02218 family)